MKVCEWDHKEFKPIHGNEKYCSTNCKLESKREKDRLRHRKYDNKPEIKFKKIHKELGTFKLSEFKLNDASTATYLGKLILEDAWNSEYHEIHKLVEKISVRVYSKGKKSDKDTTSYKGVSLDDYNNLNITFLMENCAPCPICGESLQERDLTRCELICKNIDCEGNGGLVLRGNDFRADYPEGKPRMGFTSSDISKAQLSSGLTSQMVAWDRFYQEK